ncbi:DUF2691 family protein [Lysinibacillus fusiformis]|uniref:DUF2691 family protein n=1 Tax=Lysinibacillus fusiformis TaxID=28031 RepID=UPI0037F13510
MRGISFEINKEYGKFLSDIFSNIINPSWYWSVGPGESYKIEKGTLGSDLFPPSVSLNGPSFLECISTDAYYLIFADLKAFPNMEEVVEIKSYDDFLKSTCELALLLIDSCYVSIFSKDESITHKLFERAKIFHYTNISYLTNENDPHTGLTVWG